jgi:glycosyltransferase involved in cell wall biosynthesis
MPASGPMRVLTITQEYPPVGGGAASVSRDVVKRLTELGHEVVVLTMGFAGCAQWERVEGITVFRTDAHRRRQDRCTVPEMARFVVGAVRAIRRHPEWARASICHAHFIVPSGLVAWYLKRWRGVPYVITSHGSDVLGYNRRFRFVYPIIAPFWRRVVHNAEALSVASHFLAARIVAQKLNPRLAIIPNTVDTQRFEPAIKERRVLVVGRFIPSKGVGDVLEAVSRLDLRHWHVDLVGDGPLYRKLQRQAGESNLADHVTFHGWIPNDSATMRELYGRAYLFISASYLENMSVAVLQALAAGCRVLTTAVGGSIELTGTRFFEPGDIAALRQLVAHELDAYQPGVAPQRWVSPNGLDAYASLLTAHARPAVPE